MTQQLLRIVMLIASARLLGCGAKAPIADPFKLEHTYSVHDAEFVRTMNQLCGASFTPGNSIQTLLGAEAIVDAMVEAIHSAQHTITCETFILHSDQIGKRFMDALCERAVAGVRVHLVIDALGSATLDDADVRRMEDAGVRVVRFSPLEKSLLIFTAGDVNHRSHRKLLIVDGRVGFTGGIGFSEMWLGDGENAGPWRENGYRIEGLVVAQMQGAFLRTWIQLEGEVLDGDGYLPAPAERGELAAQIVTCSPREELAAIELTYLLAITAAEQSIDIATAYFVPDDMFIDVLCEASKRGVRVRVIMPGQHTDSKMTRDASRARWQELLDAGVQLFEYQPAMYHCKVMIVDRQWTAVGSANLDPRSLRLSEEVNLNVLSERFAIQQVEIIERDLADAEQITKLDHEQRSIFDVMAEFIGSVFSPQL